MKVEAVRTPVTVRDVFNIAKKLWQEVFSEPPTKAGPITFTAHGAFESGWFIKCFNFNGWNHKVTQAQINAGVDYCERACGENIELETAKLMMASDPRVTLARDPYPRTINGKTVMMASIKLAAGHPWGRFQVFKSLEDAVRVHMIALRDKYSNALAHLKSGNVEEYCKALKDKSYFTAELKDYTSGVKGCVPMVEKQLATPTDEDWSFKRKPGESEVDAGMRCLNELFAAGPLGHGLRQPVYQKFINCGMKPAGVFRRSKEQGGDLYVDDISAWATSCATFVRAWLSALGRYTTIAVNALGIFAYLQVKGYTDKAWRERTAGKPPSPGCIFYCSGTRTSNDGHVGIFRYETEPGVWITAEGGGSDGAGGAAEGTLCQPGKRDLRPGKVFDKYGRTCWGWFDISEMGVPESEEVELPPTRPDLPHVPTIPAPPPVHEEGPPDPAFPPAAGGIVSAPGAGGVVILVGIAGVVIGVLALLRSCG